MNRPNEHCFFLLQKQEEKEAKSDIQHLPSVLQQTKSFVHNRMTNGSKNEKIEEENCERNEVKHGHKKSPDKKESNNGNTIEDDTISHPLFSHGMCRWTGCELAGFKNLESFKDHLSKDHVLDERSTAQTRVQVSTKF